jgi:hypothetical protein
MHSQMVEGTNPHDNIAFRHTLQAFSHTDPAKEYRWFHINTLSNPGVEAWKIITELFSTTSLTYDEDVLPCLSAMAQRIHKLTGQTYLAGIWKEQLPESLLWSRRGRHARRCRRGQPESTLDMVSEQNKQTYIAPSFSWTCLASQIHWWKLHAEAQVKVQVIDAKSTPRGEDVFGEVSDASIVLRGCLCPTLPTLSRGDLIRCKQSESGAWIMIDVTGVQNDLLYWDTIDNEWMQGLGLNITSYDDSELSEDRTGETGQIIYLLRVYTYPSKDANGRNNALALMLRASQARSDGFIRVGLAEDCPDSMFDGLLDSNVTIY